jgi:peptidoglycan/LPS O-acetylase OafA/YrhL
VAQASGGFRAAFLYSANWYFVREATDYFAGGQAESPVLHFWSLAVEEQFYVVWPLVLAGLTWVAGRFGVWGRNVLRGLVLVLGLVSFGWAWHLSVVAPDRAYYGTDTRIYQLLAGALLALTPAVVVRWRRAGLVGGAGGVWWRWWGWWCWPQMWCRFVRWVVGLWQRC